MKLCSRSLVNHEHNNAPIVGRVVCGDAAPEEEMDKEYIDLPAAIFGSGDLSRLDIIDEKALKRVEKYAAAMRTLSE